MLLRFHGRRFQHWEMVNNLKPGINRVLVVFFIGLFLITVVGNRWVNQDQIDKDLLMIGVGK
jgi:hypothetical protein